MKVNKLKEYNKSKKYNIYLIVFIIFVGLQSVQIKAQVGDPAIIAELQTMNALLGKIEGTSLSNKIENTGAKLISEDNLKLAQKGINALKKVTNAVKQGEEAMAVYDTEKRILQKTARLGRNYSSELGGNLISQTKGKMLEETGKLMDSFQRLITDNLFTMNDSDRLSFIEEIHQKLLSIESILDGKYYEMEHQKMFIKNKNKQQEDFNEFMQNLQKQRQELNQKR